MSELLKELRALPDEVLIQKHDALAQNTITGTAHYLTELARRDLERQTEAVLKYTEQVRNFTLLVTLLTVVNVILAAVLVLAGR